MHKVLKFGLVLSAVAAPIATASAEPILGLVGSSRIVTFDSATPGTITSSGAIVGIPAGETLTGIDRRPANGQLYSVSTSGNLYLISRDASGPGFTAQSLGSLTPPPSGQSFGIDFNPVVDRLRFVSDANQNLRINTIMTPGTIADTPVTLNGSSGIDLVAAAYRNSFAGATTTVLYGLDAVTDSLVRALDANAGTYTNTSVLGNIFAPLGAGITFTSSDRVAFDISGLTNQGFFTINDNFFLVDQISGLGTLVGGLGVQGIIGITAANAVPEPATWAMMLIGFGAVGYSLRRRRSYKMAYAV